MDERVRGRDAVVGNDDDKKGGKDYESHGQLQSDAWVDVQEAFPFLIPMCDPIENRTANSSESTWQAGLFDLSSVRKIGYGFSVVSNLAPYKSCSHLWSRE